MSDIDELIQNLDAAHSAILKADEVLDYQAEIIKEQQAKIATLEIDWLDPVLAPINKTRGIIE